MAKESSRGDKETAGGAKEGDEAVVTQAMAEADEAMTRVSQAQQAADAALTASQAAMATAKSKSNRRSDTGGGEDQSAYDIPAGDDQA